MSRLINLIGQKFGRLIVVERVDNDGHNRTCWLCQCNCGKRKIFLASNLKQGYTQSCGCLSKEKLIKRATHGQTKGKKKSKIYRIWVSMIQRCTNPNDKGYEDYGGREITVCKRWLKFENFLEDMGEAPEGHQIDRENNDKGYYKKNCRWVTKQTQMRNKRDNNLIIYDGKNQCIAAWSEKIGIPYNTLWHRIVKLNWSPERALTTPVRKIKKRQQKT